MSALARVDAPQDLSRPATAGPSPVATVPAAIELDAATLAYRRRDVLSNLSLRIGHGERVALIGPNGAGKSTVLRAVAGIIRPRGGTVRLDGVAIDRLDRVAVARRLAVVPQLAALPFATTVEELVALGRLPHEDQLRGLRAADRLAVAAAIDRVGLAGLVGRDVRELSLGERQLVLIGVAVAQAARVLLLDEPTVHLDLRHQVATMELLVDLNEHDGTTILAVLHDVGLAAHLFPRLVVIAAGRIVADGPPRAVLTPELVREVFGVDPSLVRLPPTT